MEAFAKSPHPVHACREVNIRDGEMERGFWIKFDPSEVRNLSKLNALPWGGLVSSIKLHSPTMFSDDVTVWHVTAIVTGSSPNVMDCDTMHPGCTYYDEEGDPFDPENEANWDGDQQIGFRD